MTTYLNSLTSFGDLFFITSRRRLEDEKEEEILNELETFHFAAQLIVIRLDVMETFSYKQLLHLLRYEYKFKLTTDKLPSDEKVFSIRRSVLLGKKCWIRSRQINKQTNEQTNRNKFSSIYIERSRAEKQQS